MLRADLHIHTRASYDCLSDYSDVVATARARRLDRIAITDHNEIEGALRTQELAPELVIVGEEVKTAEGVDLIGLFISRKIPKSTPALDAAQAIREQGGLVYVPHPFAGRKSRGGALLQRLESLIDIVEVFNARVHRQALNERARAWAAARGLPGGAGSDAHTLREIGRAVVELPAFQGPQGFLKALDSGRISGRQSSYFVHLASTWAKVGSRFA